MGLFRTKREGETKSETNYVILKITGPKFSLMVKSLSTTSALLYLPLSFSHTIALFIIKVPVRYKKCFTAQCQENLFKFLKKLFSSVL